ncbi:hypothetical protein BDA99DRAFT_526801 [Phascolomyces articulosus]|uniref:C2H2-type domain-containing protein n=1 Tax=Phascolomyces articulosus TaxID=60185 RepID=A0AAD5P825_9FUNG|nr:hypothetical protein BDA99DRAFT_526801 [Phascolomyces articulosus]
MSNDFAHIPEYDKQINFDILNIFSPSERWRSLTQSQPPQLNKPLTTVSNNNNNNNLYCTACKKKFSNVATFQGHLKSAKHIANEKKNKPKKAGGHVPSGRQQQQQQQPQDPAVKEGLNQLKQAITISKSSNPAPAVGVLWNLSKNFYTFKRPQSTYQALHHLINTLESLESSSVVPMTGITPSQITSTLYASRLALARLACLYATETCILFARNLYLNALHDKWKLDRDQLESLAQQCDTIPLDQILVQCQQLAHRYIDREEKRVTPIPIKADKNQSLMTILTEAIGMFQDNFTNPKENQGDIVIVLLCLATLVSKYEMGYQGYTYMEMVSQMYEKRAKHYQASQARVILYSMISADGEDKTISSWHLWMALLLALEIDDFVRVDKILQMIDHDPIVDSSHDNILSYLDMQVLVSLSKALKQQDYTTLKHTIPHQLEHLELLLQDDNQDQEDRLKLLLRRGVTDPVKRNEFLLRLQMLNPV